MGGASALCAVTARYMLTSYQSVQPQSFSVLPFSSITKQEYIFFIINHANNNA